MNLKALFHFGRIDASCSRDGNQATVNKNILKEYGPVAYKVYRAGFKSVRKKRMRRRKVVTLTGQ